MRALVVSDSEQMSGVIQDILVKEGYLCGTPDLLDLNSGVNAVPRGADLVVVVLSPDPDRALAFLAALRKATTGRLVAVGPTGDAQLILRALRDGAEHYLDETEVVRDLQSTLARVRALRLLEQQVPGKVICVATAGGGTGSSTLAANLATVLAQGHKSCALVDLELDVDDLTALLDLKPTATLADLKDYAAGMDRFVFEHALTRHGSGVSLLASPRSPEDAAHVSPQCIREALNWARALFPYVVVDVGQPLHEDKLEALRPADVILLVFRLDYASLRNVKRELEHLERNGIERRRVTLIVNRYGQAGELSASEAGKGLSTKLTYFLPDDPRAVNGANNKGIPVVLDSPRAKVSKSIVRLAASLDAVAENNAARPVAETIA